MGICDKLCREKFMYDTVCATEPNFIISNIVHFRYITEIWLANLVPWQLDASIQINTNECGYIFRFSSDLHLINFYKLYWVFIHFSCRIWIRSSKMPIFSRCLSLNARQPQLNFYFQFPIFNSNVFHFSDLYQKIYIIYLIFSIIFYQ